MRRVILTLALVALSSSACSGGSGHASPTTSSPLGPNPDVIPQVITADYVNAVFKVLNHINGNAVRALLTASQVTPEVQTDLRAIFNDPLYQQELKIAGQSIQGDTSNVRKPPGDIQTVVVQLLDSSPTCIFVSTRSIFGAVLLHPTPPAASEYWMLKPKQADVDPSGLNPTPWSLSFNANYTTPTSIPDQCSAS